MPERSSASDTLKSPTLATFGVVVVSVIGGSVIAEPIAMARIGAIPGSIVLFVMGLMNYVAVTALAGAAARSSSVSTGRGRFTRLVQEHLGARGATAAGISSLLLWFGIVVVYLLGFGRTLAEVVAGDALWWSAGLGVVVVAVVAANARRLFVRAASSVAMVNVVLLVVLMVLALAQFKWHLFVHLPFRDSAPDPFVPDTIVKRLSGASADRIEHAVTAARLQIPTLAQITTSSSLRENLDLVFGTALFVYAGQTALFSVAPEVMRADPSGRSLVRGSQYALAAAIVMNAGWVLAALSAVPSTKFLEVRSLGVEVIGAALGGPTKWLAAIVVVLGFGVGAVNAAFALADVVTERLPSLHVSEVLLIPGVSVEVEEPSVGVRLVITAIDDHGRLALVARARRDSRSEWTYIAGDQWEANSLLSRFGKVPSHRWLRLTVLGESAAAVVVRVEGTMHIEHWPRADAVWWNDDLSLAELRMVQSLVRVPADESVLAARLRLDRSVVDPMVTRLLSEGAVTRGADGELRPVLGHRHRARSAVVADLYADLTGTPRWSERHSSSRLGNPAVKVLFRGGVSAVPIATSVLLEALDVSFGRALGLVAIGSLVLLQGTLPVLLGLSVRHRAERRLPFARCTMPTSVVATIVTFFLVVCGSYALVIYRAPLERIVAGLSLAMCLGVVWWARRHGAFRDRSAVTLEVSRDGSLDGYALVGGRTRTVSTPPALSPTARSVEVVVDGPLVSPVVVRALSGDVVPARLANWQVVATVDGQPRSIATGFQMDVSGEDVDLPPGVTGPITVRWATV